MVRRRRKSRKSLSESTNLGWTLLLGSDLCRTSDWKYLLLFFFKNGCKHLLLWETHSSVFFFPPLCSDRVRAIRLGHAEGLFVLSVHGDDFACDKDST